MGAVAPHFQSMLVNKMKIEPFAIATDGSGDSTLQKMNPLTVRIFDINRGIVCTQFLDMCMSSSSTAENIFSKMHGVMEKHEISWNNCVGVSVDNTSVNMGCNNSIKTRVLQENKAIYIMGCPCHIIHNTGGKAGEAFETVSGTENINCILWRNIHVLKLNYLYITLIKVSKFNVEDLVIDIFFWFDKSTKRKASLNEYCSFCDIEYRQIVKHVNTRWLSLERAVGRVLQQYDALKSYFLSEGVSFPVSFLCHFSRFLKLMFLCNFFSIEDNSARFTRLRTLFDKPMTEVYLLFYQSSLQSFIQFNMFLQREEPIIPFIHEQMRSFLRKLASKFVTLQEIKDVNENFSQLKFENQDNQLSGNFCTLLKNNYRVTMSTRHVLNTTLTVW